jgi:hypothetical protein
MKAGRPAGRLGMPSWSGCPEDLQGPMGGVEVWRLG